MIRLIPGIVSTIAIAKQPRYFFYIFLTQIIGLFAIIQLRNLEKPFYSVFPYQIGFEYMSSVEGNRPPIDVRSLRPAEKRVFGSGVKRPETQANKQSGFPESREQWEQRKNLAQKRGNSYFRTAVRILEAKASQSSTHDPQELQQVAELLTMRGLAMGETLAIIAGKDEELRNDVEKLEKYFPNYANITAEFSDENKRSNT